VFVPSVFGDITLSRINIST